MNSKIPKQSNTFDFAEATASHTDGNITTATDKKTEETPTYKVATNNQMKATISNGSNEEMPDVKPNGSWRWLGQPGKTEPIQVTIVLFSSKLVH